MTFVLNLHLTSANSAPLFLYRLSHLCYNTRVNETVVLCNPEAGQGRSLKRLPILEKILVKNGIRYEPIITTSEDELRLIAREIPGRYERVILVGGDTTFSIVAAEFLKGRKRGESLPPLGFAGTGSANDLCRGLGVASFSKLCRAVGAGRIRAMDVGRVKLPGDKKPLLFLGSMSLGLGTSVNRHIASVSEKYMKLTRHRVFGQVLAGMAGVRRSFASGELPRTVTLGWERNTRRILFSLLTFSNIGYYANGMRLVPAVDPFDGRLACAAVYTTSLRQTLTFQWAVKRGAHEGRREFGIIHASRFSMTADEPLDIQLDGEIYAGVKKCEISVVPAQLPVFVGERIGEKT